MRTIDLDTWEAFAPKLAALFDQHRKSSSAPILFRGQADASWKLQTTLERYPVDLLLLVDYFNAIYKARPQIETYTNQSWKIPKAKKILELLKSDLVGFGLARFPAYKYMIYLRHHGFPSPLLDWTTSPYVAAFFAFSNAISSATHISIYAYLEYPEVAKLIRSDFPHIRGLDSYIRSHRRHFRQQCAYTICTVKKGEWQYACHEDVFNEGSERQDLLWKINLPVSERTTVLRSLDLYNLNGYSLFGTEESLMETVAQREILFRYK